MPLKNKFFAFGCWNTQYGGKTKQPKNYCLLQIIDDIKNNIDQYAFGIILGDNLYSRQEPLPPHDLPNQDHPNLPNQNQHPPYDITDLQTGLSQLHSLSIPIHIIFGNHDYDQIMYQNEFQPIHKITNTIITTHSYANLHTHTTSNVTIHINNVPINLLNISCNTNDPQEYDDLIKSQNHPHTQRFLNSPSIPTLFNTLLTTATTPGINLICCHYPLIHYNQIHPTFKNHIIPIIQTILKSTNKTYWLCADTHNYQHFTISNPTKSFDQFIIGTGGANNDPINLPFSHDKILLDQEHNITYTLQDIQDPYGYCEFTITNPNSLCHEYHRISVPNLNLNVQFDGTNYFDYCFKSDLSHPAEQGGTTPSTSEQGRTHPQSAGYYYKYLKYKKKYEKLIATSNFPSQHI